MNPAVGPIAVAPFASTQSVNVQRKEIQIQNLKIERQGIVDYLQRMSADKVEVALLHALEVGVVEIEARRAGFRRRTENRV